MEPITTTPIAAEGGHWYTREGKQVDKVLGADGKTYITRIDIRHARKYSLLPGCTSIIKCAAAPGLVQWQVYQGILAALTLPRRPHEPEQEYLRRVYDDSREQAKKAADAGSLIHAAIERADDSGPYRNHVQAAYETLYNNFGPVKWSQEHSFANPMGFGSKVDLYGDDGRVIVDSKTKEWDDPGKPPAAYDEHGMQLAAYRHALGNADSICANMFVSRTKPGLVCLKIWKAEELDRCWEMFRCLLGFWKAAKKFDSGWSS